MQGWWVASYVVLWIVVVALSVVVVALARQIGTLHLRLGPTGALEIDDEGPPLGEAPPPYEARDIAGERVQIGGAGEAQLVLFSSPGCRVCEQVLPGLAPVAASHSLRPLLVADLGLEETTRAYRARGLKFPVVPGVDLVQRYRVPGTPYVVVLDDSGVVRAKGTVNNLEQLEGLAETAKRRQEELERQAV